MSYVVCSDTVSSDGGRLLRLVQTYYFEFVEDLLLPVRVESKLSTLTFHLAFWSPFQNSPCKSFMLLNCFVGIQTGYVRNKVPVDYTRRV